MPMLYRWYDVPAAAAGVEIRHPFLDRRVVELLVSLPPLWCHRKGVLRDAAEGWLPEAVRRRPKALLPVEPLWSHFQNPDWNRSRHLRLHPRLAPWSTLGECAQSLDAAAPFDLWREVRPVSLSWWVRRLQSQ